MCKIKPIVNEIRTGINSVTQSATSYKEVAARAAEIHNLPASKANILKGKGWIIGLLKPIIKKLSNFSDNFQLLSETMKSTARNIHKSVRRAQTDTPEVSKLQARINGIKESIPEIKNALNEISGINDIKAATQAGGTIKGSVEAGKAIVRNASITGMATLGTLTPLPGGTLIGWVAGEKLAELCVGKPFTKQAKNLAKNIKK